MMKMMFGRGPSLAIAPVPCPGRAASVTEPASTQTAIVVARTPPPALGSRPALGLRAAGLLVNSRPLLTPNVSPPPSYDGRRRTRVPLRLARRKGNGGSGDEFELGWN